ncbi:MAG: creatininase [Sarcina sp.]
MTVLMNEMTWLDFSKKKNNSTLILPIGSTEQHGPHLPLSVDSVIAENFAIRLANEIDGIVAPTLSYGYKSQPLSGGGPLFPGTIDLNGKTLIDITVDILEEFIKDGVKKILLLNAHFENEAFLLEAISLVSNKYGDIITIIESNWWDPMPNAIINKIFDEVPFPGWAFEHAAITETSLMLLFAPHLVKTDKIIDVKGPIPVPYHKYPIDKNIIPESGVLATARTSSKEKGQLIVDSVIPELIKIIQNN